MTRTLVHWHRHLSEVNTHSWKSWLSPQTDAHLEKHTQPQKNAVRTVPPSVKPRRQHLGNYIVKVWQPQLSLIHTRASGRLSPHISGLINNCGGFVSCLFLSCDTVCLYRICLKSVILPVETVTLEIHLAHIAVQCSDTAMRSQEMWLMA